jgi:hypothetical protein
MRRLILLVNFTLLVVLYQNCGNGFNVNEPSSFTDSILAIQADFSFSNLKVGQETENSNPQLEASFPDEMIGGQVQIFDDSDCRNKVAEKTILTNKLKIDDIQIQSDNIRNLKFYASIIHKAKNLMSCEYLGLSYRFIPKAKFQSFLAAASIYDTEGETLYIIESSRKNRLIALDINSGSRSVIASLSSRNRLHNKVPRDITYNSTQKAVYVLMSDNSIYRVMLSDGNVDLVYAHDNIIDRFHNLVYDSLNKRIMAYGFDKLIIIETNGATPTKHDLNGVGFASDMQFDANNNSIYFFHAMNKSYVSVMNLSSLAIERLDIGSYLAAQLSEKKIIYIKQTEKSLNSYDLENNSDVALVQNLDAISDSFTGDLDISTLIGDDPWILNNSKLSFFHLDISEKQISQKYEFTNPNYKMIPRESLGLKLNKEGSKAYYCNLPATELYEHDLNTNEINLISKVINLTNRADTFDCNTISLNKTEDSIFVFAGKSIVKLDIETLSHKIILNTDNLANWKHAPYYQLAVSPNEDYFFVVYGNERKLRRININAMAWHQLLSNNPQGENLMLIKHSNFNNELYLNVADDPSIYRINTISEELDVIMSLESNSYNNFTKDFVVDEQESQLYVVGRLEGINSLYKFNWNTKTSSVLVDQYSELGANLSTPVMIGINKSDGKITIVDRIMLPYQGLRDIFMELDVVKNTLEIK